MSGPYTQPLVYFFGQGRADGTAAMKEILGGKGAGLAEMTTIGIPVPPGFTIASARRAPPASTSATGKTRYSCRCDPAPRYPCPA